MAWEERKGRYNVMLQGFPLEMISSLGKGSPGDLWGLPVKKIGKDER